MPEFGGLFEKLRRMVVEDPRRATQSFLIEFARGDGAVAEFLDKLALPPEGRLRQLVANALRNHPEKRRVANRFRSWRDSETDEFTRRALDAALLGLDDSPGSSAPIAQVGPEDLSRVVDIYRYVSSRLRHKMRNAMLGVELCAGNLADGVTKGEPNLIKECETKLQDAFNRVGRLLENTDAAPEYFHNQSIVLENWLYKMNVRYQAEFSAVNLSIVGRELSSCVIYANSYLLETIFWNLWINAQQAVSGSCVIKMTFHLNADDVVCDVWDNGPGFGPTDRETAFVQEFSKTGSSNRGRGLLEVQDAVERLRGTIALYPQTAETYRIRITFPCYRI